MQDLSTNCHLMFIVDSCNWCRTPPPLTITSVEQLLGGCILFNYQVTEEEVMAEIKKLNCDPKVHAILLQLPLDSENPIDADKCTNAIDIKKVSSCA